MAGSGLLPSLPLPPLPSVDPPSAPPFTFQTRPNGSPAPPLPPCLAPEQMTSCLGSVCIASRPGGRSLGKVRQVWLLWHRPGSGKHQRWPPASSVPHVAHSHPRGGTRAAARRPPFGLSTPSLSPALSFPGQHRIKSLDHRLVAVSALQASVPVQQGA